MKDETYCELCRRSPIETTEHHLIPRQFGGAEGPTAQLCIPCHKQVHAWFTNEELAGFYNTLDRLKDHPTMEKYLKFVKKQPTDKKITIKKSNRKKRK
ncbi:HNH endonuclease [Pontibacillus sp. HMF3514]|uniref:HNH endonuclease n=1 Tax=Pontibacillus sp. HMF3514 TaxID=2692425 RepID=UPI00132046E9|nr:HNH endonuclease [Pontibacillus sp. HMF3514]QHE51382.1 HNH endonuclease [Pontibacillus sp. HMF3514]